MGLHDPIPERLTQARDVHPDRLGRGRRRSLAPQLLDESIERDRLSPVDEQDGEERPLLRAAQRQPLTMLERLEPTENPELHAAPKLACGER